MHVTRVPPSQDREKLELLQLWVTELTTVSRLRDQDATDQGSTRRLGNGVARWIVAFLVVWCGPVASSPTAWLIGSIV